TSPAAPMEELRGELLARAALASDQDGAPGWGHLRDLRADGSDLTAFPDHSRDTRDIGLAHRERRRAQSQREVGKTPADACGQFVEGDWELEVVRYPGLHGRDGQIFRAMAADQDDGEHAV